MAFRKQPAEALNARAGKQVSKATVLSIIAYLWEFFVWLAPEPRFRWHNAYADADYFNLYDKEVAVARARRDNKASKLEQVWPVLALMPSR